ncbi:hypothetical protein ACP70R_000109 [Stipagrostis hirtigluma subsp. patula]
MHIAICADFVKEANDKQLTVKEPVRIPIKVSPHHHPQK